MLKTESHKFKNGTTKVQFKNGAGCVAATSTVTGPLTPHTTCLLDCRYSVFMGCTTVRSRCGVEIVAARALYVSALVHESKS